MSGYADYDSIKLDLFKLNRINVPHIIATPDNFKPYGNFVYNYEDEQVIITPWITTGKRRLMPNTGSGGGIVEGIFSYHYMQTNSNHIKLHAINNAVGGNYITGIGTKNTLLVREANYHPDGGQVFYPIMIRPFILLLSKAGDNVKPTDFVCFIFDGTCGCQIKPNIWHQPIYPMMGEPVSFKNKQGAIHACVGVDFVDEFNTVLEITGLNSLTAILEYHKKQSK